LTTDSVRFYDENADDFFGRTIDVDVTTLYETFLPKLPPRARVLDAGCGSGRDALAFANLGFDVEAIDASSGMVERARVHTGLDVRLLRFEEMDYENEFDGIWACASLLHVSRQETPLVFQRFIDALKPGGIWYLSYKYGADDVVRKGRLFSSHTEASFEDLLRQFPTICLVEMSTGNDLRAPTERDGWLNAVLRLEE